MEQILDLPVLEEKKLDYAGFWIRVVATIIDGLLLQIVQVVLSYLIYGAYHFGNEPMELTLLGMLVGVAYAVSMQASSLQATVGKMACGIRVGDENGNQISAMNALGRYLAQVLSAITLFIGYLMVIWDDKKQGLHDKLAGTYVFYK